MSEVKTQQKLGRSEHDAISNLLDVNKVQKEGSTGQPFTLFGRIQTLLETLRSTTKARDANDTLLKTAIKDRDALAESIEDPTLLDDLVKCHLEASLILDGASAPKNDTSGEPLTLPIRISELIARSGRLAERLQNEVKDSIEAALGQDVAPPGWMPLLDDSSALECSQASGSKLTKDLATCQRSLETALSARDHFERLSKDARDAYNKESQAVGLLLDGARVNKVNPSGDLLTLPDRIQSLIVSRDALRATIREHHKLSGVAETVPPDWRLLDDLVNAGEHLVEHGLTEGSVTCRVDALIASIKERDALAKSWIPNLNDLQTARESLVEHGLEGSVTSGVDALIASINDFHATPPAWEAYKEDLLAAGSRLAVHGLKEGNLTSRVEALIETNRSLKLEVESSDGALVETNRRLNLELESDHLKEDLLTAGSRLAERGLKEGTLTSRVEALIETNRCLKLELDELRQSHALLDDLHVPTLPEVPGGPLLTLRERIECLKSTIQKTADKDIVQAIECSDIKHVGDKHSVSQSILSLAIERDDLNRQNTDTHKYLDDLNIPTHIEGGPPGALTLVARVKEVWSKAQGNDHVTQELNTAHYILTKCGVAGSPSYGLTSGKSLEQRLSTYTLDISKEISRLRRALETSKSSHEELRRAHKTCRSNNIKLRRLTIKLQRAVLKLALKS